MLPNKPYKGNQIPNQPFYAPEVPATFDRLFGARVANDQLDPNPSIPPEPEVWQRPADWLPLPYVSGTEQKFAGLLAIYDCDTNFAALQFGGSGTYRVDWGDGHVYTVNLGDKAQHSYDFNKIKESTTTSQGYRQVIVTVTPVTGNLETMDLSVVHDNQDLSGYGYRGHFWLDLAVSVPQASSGYSLTFYNGDYYGSFGTLEKATIVNAGGTTDMSNLFRWYASALKEFTIESAPNLENASEMLQFCQSLQNVRVEDVPMLYDLSYMFNNAKGLKGVVLKDLNSADYFEGIFNRCNSLESVRMTGLTTADSSLYELVSSYTYSDNTRAMNLTLEDLSNLSSLSDNFSGWVNLRGNLKLTGLTNLSDIDYGFDGVNSITKVELSGLENVTSAYGAFYYCESLKEVVLEGTDSFQDTEYMFYGCYSLEKASEFDTSNVTDMTGMFEYCNSLTELPLYDTSNVEYMAETFTGCYALGVVPNFDTGAVIDFDDTFYYCYSLASIPQLDTSKVEQASDCFAYCYNLKLLPALDFSSCVNFSGFFADYANALSCAPFQNVSADISFSNCCLSRNAILDIFQGLGTTSGETVDVSYNFGAADLTSEDIAIAEDKGWTVTY